MQNFDGISLPFSYREESKTEQRFGIEIEVENCPLDQAFTLGQWTTVGDSSLKTHGIEFVSKVLQKDAIPKALDDLYNHVEQLRTKKATFGPRTSVHIHSDALYMNTQDQLTPLIFFYLLVEDLMYSFVAPHRRKNIFCVKTKETKYLRSAFVNQELGSGGVFKYAGFNLASLWAHGTIEFRMLEGTYDIDKIIQWVEFINLIHTYNKTLPAGLSFKREVKNPEVARAMIYHMFSKFFSENEIEDSIQKGLAYFRYLVCSPITSKITQEFLSPYFFQSKFYIKNFVRISK